MTCKYCQAQLAEDAAVCPVCGAEVAAEPQQSPVEENPAEACCEEVAVAEVPTEEVSTEEVSTEEVSTEEALVEEVPVEDTPEQEQQPAKKSLSTRIVAIVCSVVLLLGLGFGIWYGVTGGFGGGFGEDDVMVKDCYALDGDAAEKTADKVVAKAGNKTLTNRQLQVIYWIEVMNFVQNNSYYLR